MAQQMAVFQQPMAAAHPPGFQNVPLLSDNRVPCLAGLEVLQNLDTVVVKQTIELLEAMIGWETENEYQVLDVAGNRIFLISEKSSCCARLCCKNYRSCEFKISDRNGKEVIRIKRPMNCMCGWLCCCRQEMHVYSNGVSLGSIHQNMSFYRPSLTVRNDAGKKVFDISGPCIQCGDVPFKVKSLDGSKNTGEIRKKWGGLFKELLTDTDTFGIIFPSNTDPNMKALLLAATILVDFMYFEDNEGKIPV